MLGAKASLHLGIDPSQSETHEQGYFMDSEQFDHLASHFAAMGTRRGALRFLTTSFGVSSLALLQQDETEARKKKKKGKHKHHQQSASPPAATCTDGLKNGSESDVDCGGACPRCGNGKICATRSDCVGGLCAGGTCQACAVDDDCGAD